MKTIAVALACVLAVGACDGGGGAGAHPDDAMGAAGTGGAGDGGAGTSGSAGAAMTGAAGTQGVTPAICDAWPECMEPELGQIETVGDTFVSPTCSSRACAKCWNPATGQAYYGCRPRAMPGVHCGASRGGSYVDCGCVDVTVTSQGHFQARDCSTGT